MAADECSFDARHDPIYKRAMHNAGRERREHLREVVEHADERAFYLEALAGSTAAQLREVVRTHDAEAAIAAATVLLATRFRITVIGDGPDAEFLSGGNRKPAAKKAMPSTAVAKVTRGATS